MLDKRPIPRYMLGFPAEVQEVIMRTVESQLKEMTTGKKGERLSKDIAEEFISVQLDQLKRLCRKFKPTYISYQPNLINYIVALSSDDRDG